LAAFGDPAKIWKAESVTNQVKLDEKIMALVRECRKNYDPDRELLKLAKLDLGYVTLYDKEYPALLKEVYDGPVVLYIRGNASVLNTQSLAVVGSRKFTNYGKRIAYSLAKECALAGLTIVSGLALGIDAEAHQAALDVDGITIGVVGNGLDRIYPVSNYDLGRKIIQKGGAIISEFPPGTPPMKHNFPARNRIIAGLSQGTLVIEAASQSGALITAIQALEYNREVFAIPGNIDSPTSEGTNALIQKGAKLITKAEDVLVELNVEVKNHQAKAKAILPDTEEESQIVETLKRGEMLADEIIRVTGLNVILVNSTLTMMEMKGIITNLGGGRYCLIK